MLRKEIKAAAQRALKGRFDKWIPFVIFPMIICFFLAMVLFIFWGSAVHEYSSSSYQGTGNYESIYDDGYQDGYEAGLKDYESDIFGDDYDDYYDGYDDYYDDYDDDYYYDYESYYTPAYNYGYALGAKTGYLKGWQDGLKDIGDGEYSDKDSEVIAAVEDKPEELLKSDEFEEGILDAYGYFYSEAWEDAQTYQDEINSLKHTVQVPELQPLNYQDLDQEQAYGLKDEYYQRSRRDSAMAVLGALLLLGFGVLLLIFGLLYQTLYIPLLQRTGIDTIDGENFSFRAALSSLGKQWSVVLKANLKTTIFTFLWSLLFVFPGIWKQASYSMVNYLLKREPELTSTEAIALSKELMKGYQIEYLTFRVSFFFWYVVCGYSLGLASFYVIPYYFSAEALFFDEIYYEKRKLQQLPADETRGIPSAAEQAFPEAVKPTDATTEKIAEWRQQS